MASERVLGGLPPNITARGHEKRTDLERARPGSTGGGAGGVTDRRGRCLTLAEGGAAGCVVDARVRFSVVFGLGAAMVSTAVVAELSVPGMPSSQGRDLDTRGP